VQLIDPQTKRTRHIGYFASEEDAGRAYDAAAVQTHGPGAERNFPGEAIIELPVTVGQEQKQRGSSRYVGVCWSKRKCAWEVQLTDRQTQRRQRTGSYASEEDAARAYDCAAVEANGAGAKRNFPDAAIGELPAAAGEEPKLPVAADEEPKLPVAAGEEPKLPVAADEEPKLPVAAGEEQRTSSGYIGVSWSTARSSWLAYLTDVQTKWGYIGYYASEEDAARAYDRAAVQAHGAGAKLNFPGEAINELLA
jgi:AP2-like factor (ANT lineage)